MATTIKIQRYAGSGKGWEQLVIQTPISAVTKSVDSSETFLANGMLRTSYFDYATNSYATDGEKQKPINGEVLANVVSGLRNTIAGKRNAWVVSKSSDFIKTDGTAYSDSELNSADTLTITKFTDVASGLKLPADVQIGDNILIKALDVPDWWVSEIDTTGNTPNIMLSRLEVRKVDLSPYATKTGSEALTNKTYNGYTLGAACAKSVASSVSEADSGLVTASQVVSYVTGKQYITKSVNNLTNYYLSTEIDSKISTLNDSIGTKLTETEANGLYVKKNADITGNTTGYSFPKWDSKGLVTGSVGTVYSKGIKVGDNTVIANALMRTTNSDITIGKASLTADGVMTKTTYRSLNNFFSETILATLPAEANIGDICFIAA